MMKPSTHRSRILTSRGAVICLVLVLITVAVYWQVSQFEFVHYDDDRFVFKNPHVTSGLTRENIVWAFQAMQPSYWHPLSWISYMADAQLFGLNAGGYHVVNLLFHLLNTILVYCVLVSMTGATWRSAAVASLFALHPLHVESVAWVAERKDVLSTFFMMLTLLTYVRYVRKPGYATYLPVALFFALGLLAKPMIVTLPFVLLLMDYWPLRRFGVTANGIQGSQEETPRSKKIAGLLYEKLPLFFLAAVSVMMTVSSSRVEIANMRYLALPLRISNALVSYCEYLVKTAWPHPLAVIYPHPEFVPLWQALGATVVLAAITAVTFRARRRRPYLMTGWLWYLGTLVPVIGVVQVGVQAMADRYTYVPLIGIFTAVVWLISDAADRTVYKKYVLPGIWIAVVGVSILVTRAQLEQWRNSKTLFSHALSVTENNYVMHTNMGALLALQGNIPDAMSHYTAALKIRPDDLEANYNMGNLFLRQGKLKEAVSCYGEAIRRKPDFAPARNNLGIALSQYGDHEKALEQFREAARLDPLYEEAKNNLKLALERQEAQKAIVPPPASAPPAKADGETADQKVKTGIALVKKGDIAGAIARFGEALQLDKNDYEANLNMGLSLAVTRNFDEAIPYFKKAILSNPKKPEVYNSLGVALANTGKMDEAIAELKKAIRIDPSFAKAHNSLGVILARSGRIDEGLSHLEEAVTLQPDYQEAKKNLEIVQGLKAKK